MKQHVVIPIIALVLLAIYPLQAQKKSDYLEKARNAENDKDFAKAARNYEKVWQFNQKKTKYIYKAGEYYNIIKDFENAEQAFEAVVSNSKSSSKYPMARYYYANALKSQGKYEQAIAEYNSFLSSSEKEASGYRDIIRQEIEGCNLALDMEEGDYAIRALDNINTKKFDFAPISVSNNSVLYYSSAYNNNVRIFRATKAGDTWSKGKPLSALKGLKDKQVCNGTFDESLNTFYFTICDLKDDAWGKLTSRCEIHAISKKEDDSWGLPKAISILNTKGATSTQPNFVNLNGTDYLFFASNREGGKGGMDIWYATKMEGSAIDAFSAPRNLGTVNTDGDELTPFYSKIQNTLYFSTNGRPTIGGYDIFKTEGEPGSLGEIEQLSTPINSSTDDFYFYLNPDGNSGMLVSNRSLSDNQKTTDEDIFEFVAGNTIKNMMVSGVIRNRNGEPSENTKVELYEVAKDGTEKFLTKSTTDASGKYEFVVLQDREYMVRANSGERGLAKKTFNTEGNTPLQYDLVLNTNGSDTDYILETVVSNDNNKVTNHVSDGVQTTSQGKTGAKKIINNVSNSAKNVVSNTFSSENSRVVDEVESFKTNTEVTVSKDKKRRVITSDFYAQKPIRETVTNTYSSSGDNNNYAGTNDTNHRRFSNTAQTYSSESESFGNTTYTRQSETVYSNSDGYTNYSSSSYSESTSDPADYSTTHYSGYSQSSAGVTYKIQVHAVKNYDETRPRYEKVRRLGRGFETEPSGSHTRVILAESFSTMDEALENLTLMNEVGFSKARIVKYKDNVRLGFLPRY